jgi:hypothetical protein
MQRQCSGTTKTGERCKSFALPSSAFCVSHDPARVVELAEYRRRGGKAKSNKARAMKSLPAEPLSTAELHAFLGIAFRRTLVGKMEPSVATALSNVAKTMAELAKASDLEARMAEIERRLGSKAS